MDFPSPRQHTGGEDSCDADYRRVDTPPCLFFRSDEPNDFGRFTLGASHRKGRKRGTATAGHTPVNGFVHERAIHFLEKNFRI